ncbi:MULTISPECIES: DUF2850 domain-containing protein [Vibrio]|uniref:N-acetylglutamate synthase n=1 Tax=Vibrio bivalvicida TaxID=1276888 RepID=A0A177XVD3_9VIBR|nr:MULTISPECIES: DUF2850 domain-containing protein [Vibrio]KLN62808.1 hypothetical protein ZX61_20945 [Vibrio sp. VPAP30]OAJ92550.1 hypothetical protein APB76_19675 [Vibrio bivalvicida]
MNGVSGKKKIFERVIVLGALIAAVMAIMMASSLYQLYLEKTYPKSNVYGTWVEQNVASYAAEEFVLSPSGVAINGGIVDTQYSWDGSHLKYRLGNKVRKFKALNEEFTELQLVSEPNYQPVYRLSEKVKNNIH